MTHLLQTVFGNRTPALEIIKDRDLSEHVAVVTGGNSGIGTETVRALATAGAKVIFSSRTLEKGEKVAKELRGSGVKGRIEVLQLDLAHLASIGKFAQQLLAEPRIDFLILNAGVMACPYSLSKDNFEMQIGTNVFGHFYLVKKLEEKLKGQATPSRVIFVSSEAHRFGFIDLSDLHYKHGRWYNAFMAYNQSKLGGILVAKEFQRRWEGSSVKAYSLHPGTIHTNLVRHSIWLATLAFVAGLFLKSVQAGASTSVYAAIAPELEEHAGAYLMDCQVAHPARQAEDMELARRLYGTIQEQITAALVRSTG